MTYSEDGGFEVLTHKTVTTSAQLKGRVTRRTATEVCIKPEGSQPEVWVGIEEIMYLQVVIEGAKDLRNADLFGKSDPYCVCEINGKEAAAKVKTSVVSNNLNPQWDHEAKITDYEIGDSLVFSVYDSDIGKDDDFLGKATLEKDQICKEGFHGPLELFGSKDRKENGTLTVRVVLHNSVPTPVVEEVMTKENPQCWNQWW